MQFELMKFSKPSAFLQVMMMLMIIFVVQKSVFEMASRRMKHFFCGNEGTSIRRTRTKYYIRRKTFCTFFYCRNPTLFLFNEQVHYSGKVETNMLDL